MCIETLLTLSVPKCRSADVALLFVAVVTTTVITCLVFVHTYPETGGLYILMGGTLLLRVNNKKKPTFELADYVSKVSRYKSEGHRQTF